MAGIIRIGAVTWTDGVLSGDADQITRIHTYRQGLPAGELLPVFGNGPWVEPSIREPKGFLALAQLALGVDTWRDEGIAWPPGWDNPSDQDEVVA